MFNREIQAHVPKAYLPQLHSEWITKAKKIFEPRACWLPYHDRDTYFALEVQKNADMIWDTLLSHSGLQNVTEMPQWLESPVYRFWTLTRDNKIVLNKLLCLPDDCVGLKTRVELGDLPTQAANVVDWSKPSVLIYKGDLAPKHNIEGLILACLAFQSLNVPTRLVLQGIFEPYSHEDYGQVFQKEYKSHILKMIKSLSWKIEPTIIEDFSSEVQLLQNEQRVAINFSTAWDDDYPIYLFEEQKRGSAILCSYWGGHKELTTPSVIFVPEAYIPRSHNFFFFQRGVAESMVSKVLDGSFNDLLAPIEESLYPRPIGHDELMEYYRQARHKWSTSIHAINRGGCTYFSQMNTGGEFFHELRKIKRGSYIDKHHLVFYPPGIESHLQCHDLAYEWGKNVAVFQENIHFIPIDRIRYRDTFKKITDCYRVSLVGCESLKDFIVSVMGDATVVEIIEP
jgi:hypothetical protein